MMFIAGRAHTKIWFVRRWLREADEGATAPSALKLVAAQSTPKDIAVTQSMSRPGHPLPAEPIGHFWRLVEGGDGEG